MEVLKRKRSSIKAKLILFSKFLKTITDQIDQNLVISEVDIIQVEDRKHYAENLILEFDELQNEIESLAEDANLEKEYEERDRFYSSFYAQSSIAKQIIKNNTKYDNGSSSCGHSYVSSIPHQGLGIALKPIELPKFDGSYHNWLEFADLFESLVNGNKNLDNIRRYHYLRSSLEGGASLEFTASNYEAACKLIRDRYDNKRLLISNHVNALFNVEGLHRESSEKLRCLLDNFLKHLYALKQLGLATYNWDILLIHIISSKLDAHTLREWENTKANNEIPSFDEFRSFIKGRADLLEALEVKQADKKHYTNARSKVLNHKNSSSAGTRSFHVEAGQRYNCPICKKTHIIYHCSEFEAFA